MSCLKLALSSILIIFCTLSSLAQDKGQKKEEKETKTAVGTTALPPDDGEEGTPPGVCNSVTLSLISQDCNKAVLRAHGAHGCTFSYSLHGPFDDFGSGEVVNFTVTANGTYYVRAQGSSGSYTSNTVTVSSIETGVAVPAFGSYSSSLCPGESTELKTAISQTEVNYSLYRNSTLLSTKAGTGAAISFGPYGAEGTYQIKAERMSNLNQCKPNDAESAPITISVRRPEEVSLSTVGSSAICAGGSVQLTATHGYTHYDLYKDGIFLQGSRKNSFSVTEAGNYMVKLPRVRACGVQAVSNQVTVTKQSSQAVTGRIVSDRESLCDGEQVTFSVSVENGGTQPTYEWLVNGERPPKQGASITVSAQGHDTGYLDVECRVTSNATGCFGERTVTLFERVTILHPVTIGTINTSINACGNLSNSYVQVNSSLAGVRYTLLQGTAAAGSPLIGNGGALRLDITSEGTSSEGTYRVKAENTNGCGSIVYSTEYVLPQYKPVAGISGATNVCTPGPQTFTANGGRGTVKWKSSTDGQSWSDIGTGTTLSVDVRQTTYLKTYIGECPAMESPVKKITVPEAVAYNYPVWDKKEDVLYVNNAHPSFTFYWQTSATGTSTANRSVSISNPNGTYYLRTRHKETGCWATEALKFTASAQAENAYTPTQQNLTSINYVRSYTHTRTGGSGQLETLMMADAATSGVVMSTEYLDGLGRPIQTVVKQAAVSGSGYKDVVVPVEYDALGRQIRQFLPYATGTDGDLKANALVGQYNYYATPQADLASKETRFPFKESAYEASPLNRVVAEAAPGDEWAGKFLTADDRNLHFRERANTAQDQVWLISLTDNKIYRLSVGTGHTETAGYRQGSLHVKETVDENGFVTAEFRDKSGQVILKRVQKGVNTINGLAEYNDTYYVYDDLGNLRLVVPPLAVEKLSSASAVSQEIKDKLCFQYEYDYRNRLVKKRVPGADWVYMIYDRLDRLVFSQDGNQRETNTWAFTDYDILNRSVVTGTCVIAEDFANISGVVNSATLSTEYDKGLSTENGYGQIVYQKLTVSVRKDLSVTYYDSYAFTTERYAYPRGIFIEGDSEVLPLPSEADWQGNLRHRARGLVTGTRVRVLGGDLEQWLEAVTFYDERYRPVQTLSENLLSAKDLVTTQYDFAGNVREVLTAHMYEAGGEKSVFLNEEHEVDHMGRLLSVRHRIKDNPGKWRAWRVLSENGYNELGELAHKRMGDLQQVGFRYNIRGWLTDVNDVAVATSPDKLFAMQLHYTEAGEYNGNIGQATWRSRKDNLQRGYRYSYDPLSRLKEASYFGGQAGEDFSVTGFDPVAGLKTGIVYDANGNIKTMVRKGLVAGHAYDLRVPRTFGAIDRLRYAYDGNKLVGVDDADDAVTGPAGDFRDNGSKYAVAGGEYGYDAAGNMTSDKNKGITKVSYNYLNLPEKVELGTRGYITYTYSATGQKLRKEVREAGKPAVATDYAGMFVHQADTLFAHTSEGRVLYQPQANDKWRYEYHLKDHLGNLRVSFAEPASATNGLTMEPMMASTEEAEFERVAQTRHLDRARSRTGSHAALLGVGRGRPLGPSKRVTLHKGDSLRVEAFGMYEQEEKKQLAFSLASWLASSATVTAGANTGGEAGKASKGKALPYLGVGLALAPQIIPKQKGAPKAYLRYLVYDSDSNYVASGYQALDRQAKEGWQQLELNYTAQTDGFAEVYLANESQEEAWFDDMTVTVSEPMLVQENHYDPWGLNLVGIEKQGTPDSKWQFQGQEKQEEFGLNWVQFKWRNHQPDIGRFFNVDPLAHDYVHNSPYAFSENKVTSHIELEGLEAWSIKNIDGTTGTINGPYKNQNQAQNAANVTPAPGGFIRSSTIQRNGITELERSPFKQDVKGVVLHRTVSSTASSTLGAFKSGRNGVNYGTHFLIDKDGMTLQTASLESYTLHVGKTKSSDLPNNTNSVGIEVVGNYSEDGKKWENLTPKQAEATANLVNVLLQLYNLDTTAIHNHEDISWKTKGEGAVVREAIRGKIKNPDDEK